ERNGIVRVEPDGLVVIGQGAPVIVLFLVCNAATGECRRMLWIEPDGLAAVGDGPVVVGQPEMENAATDECNRIRIESYRLVVVGAGVRVVLFAPIGAAATGECRRVSWTKPDGLAEVGDGAVVVAQLQIHGAAIVERNGVIRVEPDRLVIIG